MTFAQTLPVTEQALRQSIIEDTPEYTKRLLMELSPTHWVQYFPEYSKKLEVVK